MADLNKKQVLKTIFACVKQYDEMLNNRNLLFVCTDKHKRVSAVYINYR